MDVSLSLEDVQHFLGSDAGVVIYSDAFYSGGPSLREQLAQWPWRAVIMLTRSSENYGHFTALFERQTASGASLEIFDSYGRPADVYNDKLPQTMKERLGQTAPFLLEAIARSNYRRVYWNDVDFQRESPSVSTCGRWCIVRLYKRALTVAGFRDYVARKARELHLTPDEWVTFVMDPWVFGGGSNIWK